MSPLTKRTTLDIYRRQARNLAWYDEDDEPSSANPFKKFRRRPHRSSSIQLAEQGTSRSLGDFDPKEGDQPPVTADSDQFTAQSPDGNGPSTAASPDPINVSSTRGLDLESETGGQTRKRGKFMPHFGRSSNDTEPEDVKDLDGPKFTVASQLRATILNSWINVLIIAAPVGSRFIHSVFGRVCGIASLTTV